MQATSAYNGVGIVKLMGRQSGFIAMHASLASGQVDVCLIPEVTSILEFISFHFLALQCKFFLIFIVVVTLHTSLLGFSIRTAVLIIRSHVTCR